MPASDVDYQTLIRQSGFRLTPQRQLILDAVFAHGHSTPQEIYTRVQAKTTAINRATVYRTLELFLELGLVSVAQVKDNQTVYERVGLIPHHHLICQRCDKVEEVDHKLVEPFFQEIEQNFSFKVNTDHLILFGLCDDCRQQVQAQQ